MSDRDKWDYDPDFDDFNAADYWATSAAYHERKQHEERRIRERIMAIQTEEEWRRAFGMALADEHFSSNGVLALKYLSHRALSGFDGNLYDSDGLWALWELCQRASNGFNYAIFKVDLSNPSEPLLTKDTYAKAPIRPLL